jgi:outer membrane protein TolC
VDKREFLALPIDKAWRDVMTAWQAAQVSKWAVEQAEVNPQEETDRDSNGIIPFSDLLDAQVLLQVTLDRRIETRGDYWVKRSSYFLAVTRDT